MSAAAAIAQFVSEGRVIAERTLPNGAAVLLSATVQGPKYLVEHDIGHVRWRVIETTFADEAEAVFDAFDGVERDWAPSYLPIGRSPADKKEITVEVHAVGDTMIACVRAFLASKGDDLDEPSLDRDDGAPGDAIQWGASFRSVKSGTGFRAAGRIVPGGYVMTWWK